MVIRGRRVDRGGGPCIRIDGTLGNLTKSLLSSRRPSKRRTSCCTSGSRTVRTVGHDEKVEGVWSCFAPLKASLNPRMLNSTTRRSCSKRSTSCNGSKTPPCARPRSCGRTTSSVGKTTTPTTSSAARRSVSRTSSPCSPRKIHSGSGTRLCCWTSCTTSASWTGPDGQRVGKEARWRTCRRKSPCRHFAADDSPWLLVDSKWPRRSKWCALRAPYHRLFKR